MGQRFPPKAEPAGITVRRTVTLARAGCSPQHPWAMALATAVGPQSAAALNLVGLKKTKLSIGDTGPAPCLVQITLGPLESKGPDPRLV